jgi:hypothetical protein
VADGARTHDNRNHNLVLKTRIYGPNSAFLGINQPISPSV